MSNAFEKGGDGAKVDVQADEVETPFGLTGCIVSLEIPSDVADQYNVAISEGCVGCHN